MTLDMDFFITVFTTIFFYETDVIWTKLRKVVIEGMACQQPSSSSVDKPCPQLQPSLVATG